MQALAERIRRDAKHLGNGIIKVDSFLNHQIDPMLMQAIGEELAIRFTHTQPTKILTAETSGIAPAFAVGMSLKIPIVFARKHQPLTMTEPLQALSLSPTHAQEVELLVSSDYLKPGDRVLIIDDFLSSSNTIMARVLLVKQSKATLIGIGAVIEKAYAGGRQRLVDLAVPIEALAIIERCEGDCILLMQSPIYQ